MATRIAWLLNLDAELELADPASYVASRLSAARMHELRARMADLVTAEDCVLDAQAPSVGDLLVQAFCPTPSALQRIAASGLATPPAPSFEVLRRVNDRSFCAELGQTLPEACFVRDMATLERQLQRASVTGRHVIKRAFSFAGREQRRVQDGVLDDSTRGFCARSFARGEGVQLEPWMDRLADFGRYGYLTRAGQLLPGPTREQRCDAFGRFLGMSGEPASLTPEEDAQLADELSKTGGALHASGYFGPFGIDAFRHRTPDGREAFNPRCEINARFSMGYPRALLLQGLANVVPRVGTSALRTPSGGT